MSVSLERSDEDVRIVIRGAFNFHAQKEFREAYMEAPPELRYTIDMGGVEHVDSSALGMLLLLREHAGGESSRIAIRNCSPEIRNLLEVAQFHSLFKINGGEIAPRGG